MSLTNLVVADLRAVNETQPHHKIQNVLNSLSTKWDQREGKYSQSSSSDSNQFYSDASLHRTRQWPL